MQRGGEIKGYLTKRTPKHMGTMSPFYYKTPDNTRLGNSLASLTGSTASAAQDGLRRGASRKRGRAARLQEVAAGGELAQA